MGLSAELDTREQGHQATPLICPSVTQCDSGKQRTASVSGTSSSPQKIWPFVSAESLELPINVPYYLGSLAYRSWNLALFWEYMGIRPSLRFLKQVRVRSLPSHNHRRPYSLPLSPRCIVGLRWTDRISMHAYRVDHGEARTRGVTSLDYKIRPSVNLTPSISSPLPCRMTIGHVHQHMVQASPLCVPTSKSCARGCA